MTRIAQPQPARFYPIVPNIDWLERVVPLGVSTIQLRLKDATADDVRTQIARALKVCRTQGCQLIVNDYWREALAAGADFIHLGQEDLAEANVAAIKAAGMRLGVSTHDEDELEVALSVAPDYVALGPIYETKLKVMKWQPQGLARIGQWKRRIGDIPLVAIAGLTPERADGVRAAGADSLAVITDFYTHAHPEERIGEWLAWAKTSA